MSDEFARALRALGMVGDRVLGSAAKAILLSLVESWAAAFLF
jgi:hypothetical protein